MRIINNDAIRQVVISSSIDDALPHLAHLVHTCGVPDLEIALYGVILK